MKPSLDLQLLTGRLPKTRTLVRALGKRWTDTDIGAGRRPCDLRITNQQGRLQLAQCPALPQIWRDVGLPYMCRTKWAIYRNGSLVSQKSHQYQLLGGDDGIRTHDALLAHTPLAGEHLRPLGHVSGTGRCRLPAPSAPSGRRKSAMVAGRRGLSGMVLVWCAAGPPGCSRSRPAAAAPGSIDAPCGVWSTGRPSYRSSGSDPHVLLGTRPDRHPDAGRRSMPSLPAWSRSRH